VIVHLVDGTYELFRHFYGLRRFHKDRDPPYGAALGVLRTVLQMFETGATHLGVATDHIIESFRNELWPGYKTGAGIERALWAQFHPVEDALDAMGVTVWPMVELEADDALASAAHLAERDARVEQVCIWTVDKDLGQCVQGRRVVQVDRRANSIRDEEGCGRSSECLRRCSRTISRWWATPRTGIRAFPASVRRRRRGC
jgi:5'-3' exonuclease